jgi:hypothetical protein
MVSTQQASRKPWRLKLRITRGGYAVCRLDPGEKVPVWAARGPGFSSVTRTTEELSIVCAEELPPKGTKCERGWRLLRIEGPLGFELTGVLLSVARPLSDAGVNIFALSTYDTDYFLVKAKDVDQAIQALTSAGHTVIKS